MRKIDKDLIDRLRTGNLMQLLAYIISDPELLLEVRHKDAFVYYRKAKVLEIKNLKVDQKYGNVPNTNLAVNNSQEYFNQIKDVVDTWLNNNNKRAEFDTQQNIARYNQDESDKYIILDMEYAFEQNQINKNIRIKPAVFDLLGIDKQRNTIVFFEVKKGMGATKGPSGIDAHITDFDNYLLGKNTGIFRQNLYLDIKNIISDKTDLGILKNFSYNADFEKHNPELILVFHPEPSNQTAQIQRLQQDLNRRCKLLIVSNNNYKL